MAALPLISVVSPVYGCRSCLEELVDRIAVTLGTRYAPFEVVLVDDASPDHSWSRIVELGVDRPWLRGLRLSRNFGQHAAIMAGLQAAKGGIVVVMDCDLQDRPEEIPRLITAIEAGAEVALAQRVDRSDGLLKRLGSWGFYKVLGWLTDTSYDHSTANFGAYSRKVINVLDAMPEADRFFPLMVKWTGYRPIEVNVEHSPRRDGKSSYSFLKLMKLALKTTISYSDKPLRLVVSAGLVFSAFAMLVVAYAIYRYVDGDIEVAGYTGIIASIWLVGSVVLSSIGVVGLYIGRLFNDSKRRPNFVISETTNA